MPKANNVMLASLIAIMSLALSGCGGGGGSNNSDDITDVVDPETPIADPETPIVNEDVDLTNAILESRSADCADYAANYTAAVLDIQRSLGFDNNVEITLADTDCSLASNAIPNHDFNDDTASFATNVSTQEQAFTLPRNPQPGATSTAIAQNSYDAIMRNGVVLDLLSAGCYKPEDPMADANGNTPVGCNLDDGWLLDPMSPLSGFGTDQHNAHTQPDGRYHYHGNPEALFDDNPGPDGSPVIGFAADGFPIFGSYFLDLDSGSVRKAVSGYTLKAGDRPVSADDPGGTYDGTYIDDYEYTKSGDLDACNGMTVDGQYGYYVTDAYPWVLACYSGTPDNSFNK